MICSGWDILRRTYILWSDLKSLSMLNNIDSMLANRNKVPIRNVTKGKIK